MIRLSRFAHFDTFDDADVVVCILTSSVFCFYSITSSSSYVLSCYNWTRPRSLLGVILKPSAVLGAAVGADVGVVGPAVGLAVGLAVGALVVGALVGAFVGALVVGALVGAFVGALVGALVGAATRSKGACTRAR